MASDNDSFLNSKDILLYEGDGISETNIYHDSIDSPRSHETTTDTSYGSHDQHIEQLKTTSIGSLPLTTTSSQASPGLSTFDEMNSTIFDLHSIHSHSRRESKKIDNQSNAKLIAKISKLSSEILILREELEQAKYKDVRAIEVNLSAAVSDNLILRQRNDEYRERIRELDVQIAEFRTSSLTKSKFAVSSDSALSLVDKSSHKQYIQSLGTNKSPAINESTRIDSLGYMQQLQQEAIYYKQQVEVLQEELVAVKQLANSDKKFAKISKKNMASKSLMMHLSADDHKAAPVPKTAKIRDTNSDHDLISHLQRQISSKDRTIEELSNEVRDLSKLSAMLQRQVESSNRSTNSSSEPISDDKQQPDGNSLAAEDDVIETELLAGMKVKQKKSTGGTRMWVLFIVILIATNILWSSRRLIFATIREINKRLKSR